MPEIITSLLPVFLVIMLGYGLRISEFAPPEAWRLVERIVYFILFPALILGTLAKADLASLQIVPMAGALLFTLLIIAIVLTALRVTVGPKIGLVGAAYSSVFQGSLRWNGFVALAAVDVIYGEAGVTVAALAIAVMVPTVNVLSVFILSRHAGDTPADLKRVASLLARNPLILACIAALFLNLSGIGLPGPIEPTTDLLGRAALTLGLLSVGTGLDIKAALHARGLVTLACVLKLIAIPLLVASFCWAFGVTGLSRDVVILCGAVPTASSSYVLARQLGGDFTLMAAIITASTLAALVTMPALLVLLG